MRFDTSTRVGDGEIETTVNRGNGQPFATIDFDSHHYLRLHDIADCDRIIKAAVDVKRRFEATLDGTPHAFRPDGFRNCDVCGQLNDSKLHAEPEPEPEPEQTFGLCPVNHANGVHGCTLKPGHDGPHQSVEPLSGHVRNEWADEPASPEAAALDAAITAGTPVFVVGDEPKCRAKHSQERYVCTVPKGHDGPHQARGPQGELYASWNAETAASVTA